MNMKNNGGSSLRDAIDRIENRLTIVEDYVTKPRWSDTVVSPMTSETIETLLYFLSKIHVPITQQDQFFRAVQQLEALQHKQNKAA